MWNKSKIILGNIDHPWYQTQFMLSLVLCETVGLAKLQGPVARGKSAMKSPICDAAVTRVVRVLSEIRCNYCDRVVHTWSVGPNRPVDRLVKNAVEPHRAQFAYDYQRSSMPMYDSSA